MVVTNEDVPGDNVTGLGEDELVFAADTVTAVGQLIAVVVAESKPLAQQAAQAVKITYQDLPSILTIKVSEYHILYSPMLTLCDLCPCLLLGCH